MQLLHFYQSGAGVLKIQRVNCRNIEKDVVELVKKTVQKIANALNPYALVGLRLRASHGLTHDYY